MARNNFKKGDEVRYVVKGPLDWESEDWAEKAGLILGHVYTVSTVSSLLGGPEIVEINDSGYKGYRISALHFELAGEAPNRATRYDILKKGRSMTRRRLTNADRRFVCYFHFVGWANISLGAHVNVIFPNVEIHLPFGFARIGWETSVGRRFGFSSYKDVGES